MAGLAGYFSSGITYDGVTRLGSMLDIIASTERNRGRKRVLNGSVGSIGCVHYGGTKKGIALVQGRKGGVLCGLYGEVFGEEGNSKNPFEGKTPGETAEILIERYRRHGKDFLKGLRGMFCVVVLDSEKKSVLLATDPTGVIPLFYGKHKEGCVFSTEISPLIFGWGLKREINPDGLIELLFLNSPLPGNTLLQHVHKVKPGTVITWSEHSGLEDYVYTDLYEELMRRAPWEEKREEKVEPLAGVFREIMDEYMDDGVKQCCMTLTGGFDSRVMLSSLNTDYLKKLKTITFGLQGNMEMVVARDIAAKMQLNHHELLTNGFFEKDLYLRARRTISISGGLLNFRRTHYHYFVEAIAPDNEFLLTGVTGSTLIRDGGFPDSVVSPFFQELLTSSDLGQDIREKVRTHFLKPHGILARELGYSAREVEERLTASLSWLKNHRSMENYLRTKIQHVIPQYFGAEIALEYKYLPVRVPFLDLKYLYSLVQTGYTVCSRDVYNETRADKLKAHYLYSKLISLNNEELSKIPTDRGYPPYLAIKKNGVPMIAAMHGWHKIKRKYLSRGRLVSDLDYAKWCALMIEHMKTSIRYSTHASKFYKTDFKKEVDWLEMDKFITLSLFYKQFAE